MSRAITYPILLLLLTLVFVVPSCSSSDDEATQPDTQSTTEPTAAPEPVENITVTIGNLTDLTGPAATGMSPINTALDDLVRYFNDEDLIPGVKLEVVTYDGQLDPSKDIPGYEWLRGKGADVIFTATPGTPVTLKARADSDHVVVFGVSGDPDELSPPGYVFNLGTIPRHEGLTLLKWIAENDWDYETKGPAKIGGAGWNDAYSGWWLEAMEDYANAHPEQFDWVSGHLTGIGTFTWGPEVEALKDCDYLFVPTIMTNFVKEYLAAGYAGKFIGASTHAAFFGQISDAGLWDEIDGMLFIASSRWWN
ncbi:ABC transporter substrate-binding protein, partial [Chloroflexota bacterium]